MKTRPTHSSCRDSVGLLAPRYMDGFCQPPLSLALFPHAYVRTRPCLFSLRSCPPRYQPGETIYFTGLALRSTGVVEFSLSLSLSFSPPFSVSSPKGDESSDGGSVVSSNKHRAVVYNGLESLVKWNSRSFHRTKFHLTWISSEPCEGSDGKAKKEFRSP